MATLATQRETEKKLQNNQYRAIYDFFEQNYEVELEQVPIYQKDRKSPTNITIGRYKIPDITHLLTESGIAEHTVTKFQEDLQDRATNEYFGRESFVTRLRKRPWMFQKVAEYCANN
jgi:hypothetical protein